MVYFAPDLFLTGKVGVLIANQDGVRVAEVFQEPIRMDCAQHVGGNCRDADNFICYRL